MSRLSTVTLAVPLLVALLAGCGGDDATVGDGGATTTSAAGATTAPATSTTPTTGGGGPTTVALGQTCTNEENDYRIRYPAGWQTNSGDVVPVCTLFDPDAISVPEDSEIPLDIAVSLQVADVAFDNVIQHGVAEEQLSRETLTVSGRQAVRVEARSTGEALLPPDLLTYRYYVNLPEGTLIASTHDVEGADYEANKDVLDRMIRSLELV